MEISVNTLQVLLELEVDVMEEEEPYAKSVTNLVRWLCSATIGAVLPITVKMCNLSFTLVNLEHHPPITMFLQHPLIKMLLCHPPITIFLDLTIPYKKEQGFKSANSSDIFVILASWIDLESMFDSISS